MRGDSTAKPNRLIHASSPYLLQHAYNPVDWFEWGDEALTKSKSEDKPILVSIGYSACHWCHVMERESFENPDIAAIMNEFFVCIKIDREERPDLDHIYMDAVHAMGSQGGWPLNVFLNPGGVPFYGGTYFPPARWSQVLLGINKAFKERRKEIEDSAEELLQFLQRSQPQLDSPENRINGEVIESMFKAISSQYDEEKGGLKKAPKFIMPSIWQFLLRYAVLTRNQAALDMSVQTLEKIACGGIYDQLGGGFARYSVDDRWFAPHFEKMLYDNGQLLSLYAEALQASGNPIFKKVLEHTVQWLHQEMTHPGGGFYSALDADTEGEEGKYYCWTWTELQAVLGENVSVAADMFSCTREGNWEHGKNILLGKLIQKKTVNENVIDAEVNQYRSLLLAAREKRVAPGLDDKIITCWNALTIIGLCDASAAMGRPDWLVLANRAYDFVLKELSSENILYRSWRNKRSSTEAFLDDYAAIILASIKLYSHTFNEGFLNDAKRFTETALQHFNNPESSLFFYSSDRAENLLTRKTEYYDNVIPSSNALMAMALFRLGRLTGEVRWEERAVNMVTEVSSLFSQSAAYMSAWGELATEIYHGLEEVSVVGPGALDFRSALGTSFHPFALFAGATDPSGHSILKGKELIYGQVSAYLCRNRTCLPPTDQWKEIQAMLSGIKSLG
ncbi:MAG: thioredoxin domain-containing protein [Bacteroidetes bacterium]|nr:thioredoxin domain-containing protein [Bacteroidota bacterium]